MSENAFRIFTEIEEAERRTRLRDEFAMAALTGMLAANVRHYHPEALAADAYLTADAMLAAREKK